MNAKKPPVRPPAPKTSVSNTSVAKNGGSGVNTPGKLRSALASLSIRYNPANTSINDSDSDEEISIVRKEGKLSPDLNTSGGEDEDFTIVQNDGSVTHLSTGQDTKGSSTTLNTYSHNNSSTESLQQDNNGNNEKRTIVKQQTWPGNSKINSSVKSTSTLSTGMRFLRREQPSTVKKDQVDAKDEADLGSQPSKSHLSLHAKGGESESSRSRSPSPFRRLYRQANNESNASNSNSNSAEKLASATVSAISLSSLLATEDKNAQNDEKDEDDLKSDSLQKDDVSGDEISLSVPTSELQQLQTASENTSEYSDYEPPFTFLLYLILIFYIYLITELPVFVNGMVVGGILAYLVGCLFLLVISPEGSLGERFQRELDEYNLRLARKPKPTYTSKDPGLLLRPKGMKVSEKYIYNRSYTNSYTNIPISTFFFLFPPKSRL